LFGEYLAIRAEQGRPLGPTQLPLGRRYVELEVMARDLFAAWQRSPSNGKLQAQYISATRAQALLASQLGESVATMARLKFAEPKGFVFELARAREMLEAET